MPRSIWRGVMSFGMVAIPVRLYLATESTSKVSFNLLCPEHKSRIKSKRWGVEGDHEVAWGDVVRGYEYEKGSYVELDDADLEKLPLRSSKAIDISGFIKEEELPGSLYYQSAYYLEPEKSAEKPYALLKKTLDKTGRIAIAKFALRDRERLVSVRPHDGALLMNTLHWPDEIRSTGDLDIPEDVKVSPAELKMAENLVNMMATEFEPDEYKDEYKEAVLKVVEAKWDGIRALAARDAAGLRVTDRAGGDLLPVVPELREMSLPEGTLLDGEIVVCDSRGRPSYDLLAGRVGPKAAKRGRGPVFVAFDLPYDRGRELLRRPLTDRRARLLEAGLGSRVIATPEHLDSDGEPFLEVVAEYGLEGIVAKRRDGRYVPGGRSAEWLKCPVTPRADVVLSGLVVEDRRGATRALCGLRADDGTLVYAGDAYVPPYLGAWL